MRRSSGVFSVRRAAATHQVEGADRTLESSAIQERRLDDSGFKSCPHNSRAASVEAIELLLKGFAGAGFEPCVMRFSNLLMARDF